MKYLDRRITNGVSDGLESSFISFRTFIRDMGWERCALREGYGLGLIIDNETGSLKKDWTCFFTFTE